jgi:hypothetical protein
MNNTPFSFYVHVPVDIPHVLMKHVIGKNGKWFRFTTQHTNVRNIWFNKSRSIVEIWGPVQNLMYAAYAIQERINYVKNRFKDCLEGDDGVVVRHEWPNDEYVEFPLTTEEYNLDPAIVRHFIGKDGRHFKKITRETGVSFIWYHMYRHCIQIWGPSEALVQAKEMLKNNIMAIASNTTIADTNIADTTIADTTIADTPIADTTIADTTIADTPNH